MNGEMAHVSVTGLISVVGLCVSAVEVTSDDVFESVPAARADLSTQAQSALTDAQIVIGSERQLATVAHAMDSQSKQARCIRLPKLCELQSLLEEHADKRVVMLASGDPLLYGVGRWLGQHIAQDRLRFFPAVSSIQLACSRVGVSWQDVCVISLHGRPVESIRTQLHDKAKLLLLTDQHSHPNRLASECIDAGLGMSSLTVFENLGYPGEQVRQFAAKELVDLAELDPVPGVTEPDSSRIRFEPLNVVLLEVAADCDDAARYLPAFPGIPDHHFETGAEPGKGMISKREVRLVILSYLSPGIDDVIWDIGAGCGGVAVELAYWNSKSTVYAVEHNEYRLHYLDKNQKRFGVIRNLNIVEGRAPASLDALPRPNKIFIGGSDGELESLLALSWQELPIGGLLVASAVTQSSRATLGSFASTLLTDQVESVELSVKRGALNNGALKYTGKLPVEIFRFRKCTSSDTELRIASRHT